MLHVRTLARQLFGDERAATPVALTGGMLTQGTTLRKRLEHRLKSAVPGAQIRAGEVNPARGAVRSALRYVGETIAESRRRSALRTAYEAYVDGLNACTAGFVSGGPVLVLTYPARDPRASERSPERDSVLESPTSRSARRRRDDGRHAQRLTAQRVGDGRVLRRERRTRPPSAPSPPSRGSCRRG